MTVRFTVPGTDDEVMESVDVMEGRFACRVPAGALDVRVRARGHVARYFWQTHVAAGQQADLGAMRLAPGASLVGSVASIRDASNVVVRATPAHAEAQLDDALVLETPKALAIEITPQLGPDGKRWRVAIRRDSETITEELATREGRVAPRRLRAGSYSVAIGPSSGGVWQLRDVDLREDQTLAIDMSMRVVRGRVTLGGKALAAQLTFGGEYGTERVSAQSDDDGTFRVELPMSHRGAWDVAVQSDAPSVKRTVRGVVANGNDVTIALPDTIVMGTVVDGDGKPVANALVNVVVMDEPLVQMTAQRDGGFAVHGLAPGAYSISATGFLAESEPVSVTLADDGVADDVRLILRPNGRLAGQVLSSGGPVAGASVFAVPTDVAASFLMMPVTDERGEFELLLPPGCREADVFVAAPGFAFRALHLTFAPGHRASIFVGQDGGTLAARWPASDLRPFLFHNGAMFEADRLVRQWNGRMSTSTELTASQLESGSYMLCMLTAEEIDALRLRRGTPPQDGRCQSAFVPRFGSAVIEARLR